MKSPLARIRNGAFILVFIVVAAVCGYRYLGNHDWIESIWLVVVTISTVGFGEHSEQSATMQLFTVAVIVLGMSASVYTMSGLLQLIFEGELERELKSRRMSQKLNRLSGHVIVCGFGGIGWNLANEIRGRGQTVVVIDISEQAQKRAEDNGFLVVLGDATQDEVLQRAAIERADTLVTGLPSDAENVFITLTARNINPGLQIISRAEHESTAQKLQQAGANRVVMPSVAGARQMARIVTHPSAADLIDLVSQSGYVDIEIDEIKVTQEHGETIAQLAEAYNGHELLVIAIRRADGSFVFNPRSTASIGEGDVIIVMGDRNKLEVLSGAN